VLFTTSLFVTLFLVIFTSLPIWRFEAWWVRSLDFPRLQLFVISLLLLLLELVLLDLSRPSTWVLLIVALLCLVYHAWWILPYTRLFPVEVKSAVGEDRQRIIRIMTANVLTPNRNAKGLIELVRENVPDILVTLESDGWWQARLDSLEPDYPYTINRLIIASILFASASFGGSWPDGVSQRVVRNMQKYFIGRFRQNPPENGYAHLSGETEFQCRLWQTPRIS
jgi:hypothetical protein